MRSTSSSTRTATRPRPSGRWRSSSSGWASRRAGGCSTSPAGRAATRRAFEAAGARCVGLDLSAALLRVARGVTGAPLVRADMRALPVRPASMDLTVNLFTSFGYFERDAEHAAALGEMVATVRPRGWFVIDFLNAAGRARAAGAAGDPAARRRRGGGGAIGVARRPLRLQDASSTPSGPAVHRARAAVRRRRDRGDAGATPA